MKEMVKRVREEKDGFTIAELLIVVAIVAVLVAIEMCIRDRSCTAPARMVTGTPNRIAPWATGSRSRR